MTTRAYQEKQLAWKKLHSSSALMSFSRLKDIKAKSTVSKETGLRGVKLPKVSVSTFVGKVLSWKSFWEQFDATIHCKTVLNDTEKLLYLQDALKDGPARFVIQKLTETSESYEEAINCLNELYNWPRLVHEEQIRSILDAVPLKNGSDKEIHRLYDAALQHYRALKAGKTIRSTQFVQQSKWSLVMIVKMLHHACTEFLKFLDLHVKHLESVSYWTLTSLQI